MFWFVLIVHIVWLTLAIGKIYIYIKEPVEPWRYFVAVLACTIWAVPSAYKTYGG